MFKKLQNNEILFLAGDIFEALPKCYPSFWKFRIVAKPVQIAQTVNNFNTNGPVFFNFKNATFWTYFCTILYMSTSDVKPSKTSRFHKLIRIPRRMLVAFLMEGVETKQMVHTFMRQGKGRLLGTSASGTPSEEEIKQAIAQFKDLPKFLPFFVIVVAPIPGMAEGYVLLAVTLEKWLGQKVSLLPSNFRNILHKHDDEKDVKPKE